MHSALSTATSADDLVRVEDPSLPYAFPQIFFGEGFFARRRNKKRLELIQQIDEVVQQAINPNEKIVLVTTGIEYSFLEHYFMGLWAMLLNRQAIVMTDARILLIQVNSRGKVKELRSQIRYAAIKKVQRGMLGYVRLVCRQGKPLLLTGIPGADKKRVRQALEHFRKTAPTSVFSREYLCPHCSAPSFTLEARCEKCHGTFKSPTRAFLLSLLLPGLGDLYLNHKLLGVFEILGAGLAWLIVGAVAFDLAAGADGEPGSLAAAGIVAAIAFVFVHGTDALITRHTARKGLYADQPGPSQVV